VVHHDKPPRKDVVDFLKAHSSVTSCESSEEAFRRIQDGGDDLLVFSADSWLQEWEKMFLLQDDFLSIVAHELKSPVTALTLQMQILDRLMVAESQAHSPQFRRSFDLLSRQVEKLQRLIDVLLDAAMLRKGKMTLRLENLNFSLWLQEKLESFAPLLIKANCTLQSYIQPGLTIQGDELRLEQVLNNLISNILKYAPGSPVHIRLQQKEEALELTVSDGGPGIPREKQDCLFGRYKRGVCDKKVSGLGLGLFVAQEVVHSHQGRIRMESEVGQGTRFIIEIPLATMKQQQEKKQGDNEKDFNH
jgi:signal transduction histidine kinase